MSGKKKFWAGVTCAMLISAAPLYGLVQFKDEIKVYLAEKRVSDNLSTMIQYDSAIHNQDMIAYKGKISGKFDQVVDAATFQSSIEFEIKQQFPHTEILHSQILQYGVEWYVDVVFDTFVTAEQSAGLVTFIKELGGTYRVH